MKHLTSLMDRVSVLIIVGILAGALGGLAIGVVAGRSTSSTSSTAK